MLRIFTMVLLIMASPLLSAETEAAGTLVKATAERMLSRIEQDRNQINDNPRHVYDLVDEILLPHIDFERMSKWVLGKYWRRASPAERTEFVKEFRDLIIRTYSTALLEYSGQEISFLPVRDTDDPNLASVRTEIRPASGPVIPISYDLYRNNAGKWLVYDVAIDGISLVANYRSSFASQIRRAGGITHVINEMKARNQQAQK